MKPSALSRRRVISAFQRAGGRLVQGFHDDPTFDFGNGRVEFLVDRGRINITGTWDGHAYEEPDELPLVLRINELNKGDTPFVFSIYQPPGDRMYINVRMSAYCGHTAAQAQLDLILETYMHGLREAFGMLDEMFPKKKASRRYARQPKFARRRKVSTRYELEELSVDRVLEYLEGSGYELTGLPDDSFYFEFYGDLISVRGCDDGTGDVEISVILPSARCGCDLGELVAWTQGNNLTNTLVGAYLMLEEEHDDLEVLLRSRIPAGWGYSDTQLERQIDATLQAIGHDAFHFYTDINPLRMPGFVFENEA